MGFKASDVTDIVMAAFVVGGILVLTRPGSQGVNFVRAVGGAFSGLLRTATGQRA